MHASLTGPHAHFAERQGDIVRYPLDVAPFLALPAVPTAEDWLDLATLAGPGVVVPLAGVDGPAPDGWEQVMALEGVQMIDAGLAAAPDSEAVRLTRPTCPRSSSWSNAPSPDPSCSTPSIWAPTWGVCRGGVLVALAGERLHPLGWTEISAVCTHAAYRGRGLGGRLVRAVARVIRCRGETPFLHAVATNANAIRLYESLGFRLRRRTIFSAFRAPE